MKSAIKLYITLMCAVTLAAGTMAYTGTASGDDTEKDSPNVIARELISSHTARIMDALYKGDSMAAARAAKSLAKSSQGIVDKYSSEDKEDVVKYLTPVISAAKDFAEVAKTENTAVTFEHFNSQLMKSCFECHDALRPEWQEWGDWMIIAGG